MFLVSDSGERVKRVKLRSVFKFLLDVYNKFNEHSGFLLAAGIAFFTFFSLFPLLLFSGIVLGYVIEGSGLREQILSYVFKNFPALSGFVKNSIEALIASRSRAGIIALIALLWSGTSIFGGFAVGLNAVYEVKETRNIFIQKLVALGVFLIIIVLTLVSFGTSTLASTFRSSVLSSPLIRPVASAAWTAFTALLGLISTLLLFLIVYRLVPNVKLSIKNIWVGTLVSGFTFEVAKYFFALYLNAFARRGYGLVYGSLATVILLMFWLYIFAVLLLIGAEINVLYRRRILGGVKTFEPRKGSRESI